METTTVVEEAHHSCSSNIVVKSVESPIKNDIISRDLVNADDIDTRKCEHFSIREYASEMRKKDWKKSWPFALDGGHNILKEQSCKLPPLLVPKFRWWCCQNCLPETGTQCSINEERIVTNNSSKLKSFGSCPHMPSLGDADSRKSGAIACVNVNSSAGHPLVSDKSEKKAENADIHAIDTLENNNNKEIHISNYAGIEVISSLMRKTLRLGEKVASLQLHNPNLKDNEIASPKLPESYAECIVKDATETRQTGKYGCDQQMELVKGSESHGIASMVHRVPNAIKTHRDEHPSLELDDCDYASSESDEVLPGAVSGSLHRRKNRKVRLLTELLDKNKDEKTNLTSAEDSPSSTIPDASIGIDSISASQGQINFQGNACRKKRKMPQDEEWVPGEFMCSPGNGHKNLKSFNRDAETADGITSSDSEGTINRSSSQTPAKSNLVNAKVYKTSILGKKKNKKTQNFDEFPSLRLSRENLQNERQKKPLGDITKTDATDIVLNKSIDVSTSSGLNPIPEFAAKAEKKSNLLKKKSKIHQDHDWQASRVPWNNGILREGPISRKDVEIRQTGNVAVPLEVTWDASAEKGLECSLSNCLPVKRYDAKYSTPIRDGQGQVLSEYNTKRKDLNMNYVSQAGAYDWKGMHVDLNSNQTTYKIPFLNEKQDRSPAEVGSSLIRLMNKVSDVSRLNFIVAFEPETFPFVEPVIKLQKLYLYAYSDLVSSKSGSDISSCHLRCENLVVLLLIILKIAFMLALINISNHVNIIEDISQDFSGTRNNGKTVEFQDHVIVSREHYDKRVEMASEQGSVDDIMEIAELMAKNQYESMNLLEQRYSPAGFKPFPLCGEKPLNGVQFSATNSIKQNRSQNCQWVGNMAGQKTYHANVQELGVCNTCHRAPQKNKEVAHLWPSMMPNNLPYMLSIPSKCADQVTKLDVLRHCTSSLPEGYMCQNDDRNFLDRGTNYEKHCRKFDSEALGRTHADYSFSCKHNGTGSLDLYSNETIPAMHLLSLMDAGLQSGAPVDVDGNQRFVKKTPFLPGQNEFSSMPSGGYRTNSMKHPSFDCYGKSHLPGSFCECMSATAAVGPSTSSFQHDKIFKKAPEFTGQLSLKSREKVKKKYSDSQRQNKNHKSQKDVSSNSGLSTTCGSIPVHSMPKLALRNSEFMMSSDKLHAMESATKQKQKAHTSSGTLFHPKSGSENGICSINRNPADFTVPGAANIYMTGSEDLKFGREKAPSSGSAKLAGHKRLRKLTARKELSRNRTS
ncbi:Embryonic flower 1, putative isoform 2 [Hibiscus syriacus]|uniref:Embryonic flower 1, putative isoform 2 n=1 Tax=Hibiscus syriacus TaxID=106335 RepID=A0A6A2X337_HIBSY|nr:Embryonic flower 1, putative isoform 2 [Hibiscus syriacus]